MIPRILHQTWREHRLPPGMDACRKTWLDLHPTWDHRFYDDAACRDLVASDFPDALEAWEALPRGVMRADLFRWMVVFRDGGVYADLDMRAFRPSDRLIDDARCVLSVEAHLSARRQHELGYRRPYQIANCIFAAEPGHPFVAAVLDALIGALGPVASDDAVEDTTGPRRLTRLAHDPRPEWLDGLRLLPQIHWMAPHEYPPWAFSAIHARHEAVGSWRTTPRSRSVWRRWVERNRLPWPFATPPGSLPG